mgnify:CR=1 FL=1
MSVLQVVHDVGRMRIPLARSVFTEEMEKAAVDALWNERFVLGESVYRFEEEFAKYCGVAFAVSTNSGTDALQIALTALGVTRGQRVITSPASFVASSNVILHVDAIPIFATRDFKPLSFREILERHKLVDVDSVVPLSPRVGGKVHENGDFQPEPEQTD